MKHPLPYNFKNLDKELQIKYFLFIKYFREKYNSTYSVNNVKEDRDYFKDDLGDIHQVEENEWVSVSLNGDPFQVYIIGRKPSHYYKIKEMIHFRMKEIDEFDLEFIVSNKIDSILVRIFITPSILFHEKLKKYFQELYFDYGKYQVSLFWITKNTTTEQITEVSDFVEDVNFKISDKIKFRYNLF